MTAHAAGPSQPGRAFSLVLPALILTTIAVLAVAVVAERNVEEVAQASFVLVLLGLGLVKHRTLLAWPSLVGITALVILLVPIRREAQFSSLPFAVEPYRILLTLVIAGWIAALLVDHRVSLRRSFLDAPLLAILAATAGSIVANIGRIVALDVESGATKALVFLVSFLLFLWLIVSVIRRFEEVDLIVRMLVAAGGLITLFSLVEARTGFSVFDELVRILPGSGRSTTPDPTITLPTRGGQLRIFGSAQHPIELSAIMAMLVPMGVYLAYTARRLWWWVALALLAVGALASLSRTGLLMLVVVVAVFLWLRPRHTVGFWPLVIPGVVIAHVAAPGALRELLAAFFPVGGLVAEQQEANVGSGRLSSLGPALDQVAERPVFGGGYGTRIVLGQDANSFILDNMWLSLALEVGLLGVAAWLFLFVRFIGRTSALAKRDQSPAGWLAAALTASVFAYAVGMLTFDTLSFIQVTFLLVIVLALGTSLVSALERERVGARAVPAPGVPS